MKKSVKKVKHKVSSKIRPLKLFKENKGILFGKVVIVTGGTSGIGEAIADKLASLGAKVVVSSRSQTDTKHYFIRADVSKYYDSQELIRKTIEKYGKVDILVNNAGIYPHIMLKDMNEAQWDEVININLKGVFNCTKAVVGGMIERKQGKIVNISSVAGTVLGYAGYSHYSASKGGIAGFTKSLGVEVAPFGINVNAVAPGIISTPGTKSMGINMEDERKLVPKGRVGTSEDIAKVVAFLVSDQADYIVGQTITVDGGMSLD